MELFSLYFRRFNPEFHCFTSNGSGTIKEQHSFAVSAM
jgi:hypothetical protein